MSGLSPINVVRRIVASADLLLAQQSLGVGPWIDTCGVFPFTIDVSGIQTAVVQLRASNSNIEPLDSGRQLGADINSDIMLAVMVPVRFIRCEVVQYSAGTINARFQTGQQ